MKKIFELIQDNLLRNRRPSVFGPHQLLPIITISRERGSGGRLIAYKVAQRLGRPWQVYHKEIIEDITKRSHLEKALIKEVDEKRIPTINRLLLDVFSKKYSTFSNYYKHLLQVLATIGNRGRAIIIGRGANFLFPHALNVRIICPMAQRIAWMMRFEKMSRSEAELNLADSDRDREEYNRVLFHHSPKKAHHYDLIIRTGEKISLDDAADIIVYAARKRFGI
ncbi:cytidylate kinase-like family protein [Patescibacteria group bacterium]|nr:cytidylate kinase-like family protein [Patescibacteria group bacterium]MCL5091573.1 cytidylate kinase-like family protein [Patescibacteria group bacterium]